MILLREDKLTEDYSIKQIASFDTKAAILESFRILHVGIAKSYTKDILSSALEHIFHENPALFTNALSTEETALLSKLVVRPQGEYVVCPAREGHHLLMQKLHLVLTYRDGDQWHLYMPDKIRKAIGAMAERDIQRYPELVAFSKLLEEITEHRNRLFELMDKNNPDTLDEKKIKQLKEEAGVISQFYSGVDDRLKKLEPYLKANTSVDLKMIHDDIERTRVGLVCMRATLAAKEQEVLLAKLQPVGKEAGMKELTLRVQLDQTPIYRTMRVIDRCSLFELNMLIQFLYNWNEMNLFSFVFDRDGEQLSPNKTVRLSALTLKEGDTFQFKYDRFGDNWMHTITVQRVTPYEGKEEDYEPVCIAGYGPDPGEGAGGNTWVKRNYPNMVKNKRKYYPFDREEINDTIHFWWTMERLWWIDSGRIKYEG